MAKKNLENATNTSADFMDAIAAGNTKDTVNTKDIPDTQGARAAAPKRYRINLNLPIDCRDYLAQRAYDESSPGNIVSITQYLTELIRKDMQEHGQQ